MKVADLFVQLRLDTSKVKGDIDSARSESTRGAQGIASEMTKVLGAVAFGAGLKKSVDAASDLNETLSKTKVLFGDDSAAVIEFSTNTAQSMGLSQRAYLDAAAGLKGLLDNLGLAPDLATEWSQKLTALGSDLGSFFNKDPAEAVAAIGSAMRGESEPIRAFNVQINEAAIKQKALELGLYDGVGAIDSNAKAQATLALIMEQTTAAQGDFARTADGAANSQRIASAQMEDSAASLGQAFLPIYTKVVQTVTFLAEKFAALPQPIQLALVALAGLVALSGPIGKVAELMRGLTDGIKALGVSGTTASLGLGALGLVVIGATAWYKDYADKKAKLIQITNDFTTALKAEEEGQKGAVAAAIAKGLSDKDLLSAAKQLGLSTEDLAAIVTGKAVPAYQRLQQANKDYGFTASTSVQISKALGLEHALTSDETIKLGQAFGLVNQKLAPLNDGLENAKDQMKTAATVAKELGTNQEEATKQTGGLGEAADRNAASQAGQAASANDAAAAADLTRQAQERAAKAEDDSKAATDRLKDSLDDTSNAFTDAADAADTLSQAIDDVFGGSLNLEDANRNLLQAIDDVGAALKENGTTLDINTEAGRSNRETIQKQAEALLDYGVALVGAGHSNQEASDAIAFGTTQLRNQLTQAGLTEDQVNAYIDTLGLTPENVNTAITLAGDAEAKERLGALIEQLGTIDAGAAAEIQALIDQGKYDAAQAKIEAIAKARSITLDLVPGQGLKLMFGPGQNPLVRFGPTAIGGIFDRPSNRLIGEDGTEVVLPLSKPERLRALLRDPRVSGPVGQAMGEGSSVATSSASYSQGVTFTGDFYTGLDLDAAMRIANFHLAGFVR